MIVKFCVLVKKCVIKNCVRAASIPDKKSVTCLLELKFDVLYNYNYFGGFSGLR